jgi:membrane protein DedA with SNARE-associated domain
LKENSKNGGIGAFDRENYLGGEGSGIMAAGVMRMPLPKFLMTDAVAACLTMTLWVGIGCWGGLHVPVLREDILRIQKIILVALAVITPVAMLFRFYRNRFVGQRR